MSCMICYLFWRALRIRLTFFLFQVNIPRLHDAVQASACAQNLSLTFVPVRFNAAVTQGLLLHASDEPPEFSSHQDNLFCRDDDGSGLELE
jgi:hypothetical protein